MEYNEGGYITSIKNLREDLKQYHNKMEVYFEQILFDDNNFERLFHMDGLIKQLENLNQDMEVIVKKSLWKNNFASDLNPRMKELLCSLKITKIMERIPCKNMVHPEDNIEDVPRGIDIIDFANKLTIE